MNVVSKYIYRMKTSAIVSLMTGACFLSGVGLTGCRCGEEQCFDVGMVAGRIASNTWHCCCFGWEEPHCQQLKANEECRKDKFECMRCLCQNNDWQKAKDIGQFLKELYESLPDWLPLIVNSADSDSWSHAKSSGPVNNYVILGPYYEGIEFKTSATKKRSRPVPVAYIGGAAIPLDDLPAVAGTGALRSSGDSTTGFSDFSMASVSHYVIDKKSQADLRVAFLGEQELQVAGEFAITEFRNEEGADGRDLKVADVIDLYLSMTSRDGVLIEYRLDKNAPGHSAFYRENEPGFIWATVELTALYDGDVWANTKSVAMQLPFYPQSAGRKIDMTGDLDGLQAFPLRPEFAETALDYYGHFLGLNLAGDDDGDTSSCPSGKDSDECWAEGLKAACWGFACFLDQWCSLPGICEGLCDNPPVGADGFRSESEDDGPVVGDGGGTNPETDYGPCNFHCQNIESCQNLGNNPGDGGGGPGSTDGLTD